MQQVLMILLRIAHLRYMQQLLQPIELLPQRQLWPRAALS